VSQLIVSNFSPVTIVIHQFFTLIAVGDVDLHFSLVLSKASAVEEEKK
jgi:hypothetical protein